MYFSNLAVWLSDTQWSIALRESIYAYSWIETAHVLGLALFAGTVWILDLRLLGMLFASIPLNRFSQVTRAWFAIGCTTSMSTGALLFYANPVRTYHSFWFRVKVLLICAAAVNAALFHLRSRSERLSLYHGRISAVVSLLAWAGVIVTGRLIAQSWFDCDQAPAGWISWFSGCAEMWSGG